MADHDVPEDLVALKIALWAASAECEELAARSATSRRARRRLRRAKTAAGIKRLRLLADIYGHPWWVARRGNLTSDRVLTEAAQAAAGKAG